MYLSEVNNFIDYFNKYFLFFGGIFVLFVAYGYYKNYFYKRFFESRFKERSLEGKEFSSMAVATTETNYGLPIRRCLDCENHIPYDSPYIQVIDYISVFKEEEGTYNCCPEIKIFCSYECFQHHFNDISKEVKNENTTRNTEDSLS